MNAAHLNTIPGLISQYFSGRHENRYKIPRGNFLYLKQFCLLRFLDGKRFDKISVGAVILFDYVGYQDQRQINCAVIEFKLRDQNIETKSFIKKVFYALTLRGIFRIFRASQGPSGAIDARESEYNTRRLEIFTWSPSNLELRDTEYNTLPLSYLHVYFNSFHGDLFITTLPAQNCTSSENFLKLVWQQLLFFILCLQ